MLRPLTVGIDARKIHDFGIGRYLEGLLGGLAELDGEERFVLYVADARREALPGWLPEILSERRFPLVPCTAPLYSLRELFAFRGVAQRDELDVLHFPHYVRATNPGCPIAVTMHDAIHLTHPPHRRAQIYARIMMDWSAQTAAVLFADSRAARDDIAERLGTPTDRFRITHLAAADFFAPPAEEAVADFRRAHDLGDDFVLVVASHRPHKNLEAGVAAVRRLHSVAAVVPARDGEAAERVRKLVAGRARLFTPVSDADLPLLYAAARIVLIPSLAEGFGLPALEAAACGAAVVATPLPSHREILSGAVAFAQTTHERSLATALAALWSDEKRLLDLRCQGPAHASQYSWRKMAGETLAGYHAAAAKHSRR